MLYYILNYLSNNYDIPGFGVFQYFSFRAILAAIFSLFISLIIGKKIIDYLKLKLIGESIREVGPETHKAKAGTPTMGGVIIIASICIPTILWGDLTNAYTFLLLMATLWMGFVGFLDDYIKVFKKNKQGLKGKFKIFGQVTLGLIVGLTMVNHPDFKGMVKRVGTDQRIKVNDALKGIGFLQNDKLIEIDGYPYDSDFIQSRIKHIVDNSNNDYFKRYTLERTVKYSTTLVTLKIEKGERPFVFRQLFGRLDESFATKTNIPFLKNYEFDYQKVAFWSDDTFWGKILYVLVAIFIVTAVSNGVNITDGLDGLAAGISAIVGTVLGVFAYISGNSIFANYLNISFIPGGAEVFVFAAALIGACIGFLWYNAYPAQVFMGDTGSLALGGAIGVMALMVKKELLLPLICAIFFVESLSVILQVSYFKYTKKKYGVGRRIFKMSPLHHHFELIGWHESKIVSRFWIIAIILEILAFATLKLR